MPVTLDRTAQILRDAVATGCVPGLVAAVDHPRHGTGVHVLGDNGAGRPLRRDTIVRIASVTKPVVAVAALALVEDGMLDLDEPVAAWLPEFAAPRVLRHEAAGLDDTVPARRPITLYDLLTYRSGIGMLPRPPAELPVQRATAGLGSDGPPGSYPLPDPTPGPRGSPRCRSSHSPGRAGSTTPPVTCSVSCWPAAAAPTSRRCSPSGCSPRSACATPASRCPSPTGTGSSRC